MKRKILEIQEYFIGMNVTQEYITVILDFPNFWQVENEFFKTEYNIDVMRKDGYYYVICDFDDGFDQIFQLINYIIKINKEMEEKNKLLEQKAKELSELFTNASLEELRNLKFNISENKQQENTKTNNKRNKKKEEKYEQQNSNGETGIVETVENNEIV